jgi:hypothetical protein
MTTIREFVAALAGVKEEETKQTLTEGTADTVRYITQTKALFTNMEDAEETQLDEKWNTEMHTKEKDKGMFKGKSQSKIKSALAKLKERQAAHKEKHGSADKDLSKKIKQHEFALRAKHSFGKVKECIEILGSGETIMEAIKELETLEDNVISEYVQEEADAE